MDMGSMGGMSMGSGIPTLDQMQQRYWIVIGIVIGYATLVNIWEKFLCRQRYVILLFL